MLLMQCPKCRKKTYHVVSLIYSGDGIEMIATICMWTIKADRGCYYQKTHIVEKGVYAKLVSEV